MFTGKARGKLVPYAGPSTQTTALGAPVLPCPTCSGTGRVIEGDALADAGSRAEEGQRQSINAMLVFLRGEAQILRLLPDEQDKALELADKLGSLIMSGLLTFDEDLVRSNLFSRLWDLKKQHGPRLSWETLRRVAVRLYPPLRDDFITGRYT